MDFWILKGYFERVSRKCRSQNVVFINEKAAVCCSPVCVRLCSYLCCAHFSPGKEERVWSQPRENRAASGDGRQNSKLFQNKPLAPPSGLYAPAQQIPTKRWVVTSLLLQRKCPTRRKFMIMLTFDSFSGVKGPKNILPKDSCPVGSARQVRRHPQNQGSLQGKWHPTWKGRYVWVAIPSYLSAEEHHAPGTWIFHLPLQ